MEGNGLGKKNYPLAERIGKRNQSHPLDCSRYGDVMNDVGQHIRFYLQTPKR